MGNLGDYQTMTKIAKKVGGPKALAAITFFSGFVVLRLHEAGAKMAVQVVGRRSEPSASQGNVFRATADGNDGGVCIRVGDQYRVLERDGDAILIEVLGDSDNPYFVAGDFLTSISNFPQDGATPGEALI